ncbi:methylenetetrahydrofolate reductase [NAD(P)H] [Aminithiophilus ramosus]|uniref:Methylenetetrahydrofolate reductase n=1 Tax=Aminithiophilus ramosus TaxID=3029084 RepID=A0A9Q7ALX2_9BACT|nr:methylenetetrahydrofolate reductase [NAD(P)H] [Aminithiophilus ramosus]
MFIVDLFRRTGPVVSFEIFPPKADVPVEKVYDTIEAIADLEPGYVSVTYGAGGSSRDRTVEIASRLHRVYGLNAVAHLTGMSHDVAELDAICTSLLDRGVTNILALRGDRPLEGPDVVKGYPYASELIAHIRSAFPGRFCIAAAAYPEGHVECADGEEDLDHLKEKVEAGADLLISQLFFDNERFHRFRDRLAGRAIDVPLVAGVFPVLNVRQVQRIVSLCGASLPPKFTRMMARYANHPEALAEAGVAYATEQIVDLLASGVDGIHLYTMNRPETTRRIMANIGRLRSVR